MYGHDIPPISGALQPVYCIHYINVFLYNQAVIIRTWSL
ncbi:hypothetical protein CHCC14821_1014 [Bacillus paralicheniformis]|nr:hypothetical protein CHCC14821_1014 [Bacillus paralicheniformis]